MDGQYDKYLKTKSNLLGEKVIDSYTTSGILIVDFFKSIFEIQSL